LAYAHEFGPQWIGVERFATLPDGVRYPEGITANPATGDVFVATFDFGPNAGKLMRFSRNGQLKAVRDMGVTPMLGLGFASGKVYILNMGASKVQRIAANFDSTTAIETVADVPQIGAPADRAVGNPDGSSDTIKFGSNSFPAPNAMVFDHSGNLYFSDSFQGAVFRIDAAATCTTPCAVTAFSHDPMLATAGFPPFGANGLALDGAETSLFVAVTGDSRVLKMNLATKAISVFAESIHGADGLAMDSAGRLWVAANQADEVVALNTNGRVILRAGGFDGIRHDGTPRGMLFPASMVIVDGWMYVTNLALPLTGTAGDEPEEDVTRWNVVRFRLPRH
jgi:DNA-binding beta-propeller fold protein YncE